MSKIPFSSFANRYANPSYSSTGINRKGILSATPQQKFSNFNTLSCNSKYELMSERKYQPDLRPLADSKYHQQCIEKILDFCSRNNYTMRRETLSFMSLNEMEKLFSFILSFYEIKIKQNSLEIEITRVMKSLSYPHNINKSTLRSYATPTSKGVVLSMLTFLIEPLLSERKMIINNQSDEDMNLKNLKLILNRNQDEKDNSIKQQLNKQLMKKNALEALINRTEELRIESHSLDNQDDQLKQLHNTLVGLEKDLKGFKDYEEEMRNYCNSKSRENDELKRKIQETEEEIKNLNEKKVELVNKIKEQPRSVDEINYQIERDRQVQNDIHRWTEKLKELKQDYYKEKLKQDELLDSFKELFFQMISIIRNFKKDLPDAELLNKCLHNELYTSLIPFLESSDFEIDSKFDIELYTGFLKSIIEALNKDLLTCKQMICECQSQYETSLKRIKELENKNELIITQKQMLIDNLEKEKLSLINKITNKKKEIEDVKSEINAIDTDVKLKRKMAMNENLERNNKVNETRREFNDYWATTKNKIINLESQLKSILPVFKKFVEEKQQGSELNKKLDDLLNEERNAVKNLM